MQLTPQQNEFINAALEGEDNVTLVARAGSGKTSTILKTTEACVREEPHKSIMLCAYNKSIERELTDRLVGLNIDPNVARAKTAHAAGLGLVTSHFGRVQITDKKIANILKDTTWNGRNLYLIDQYFPQICKLVGFAKNSGFGYYKDLDIENDDAWYAIADHYGINSVQNDNEMRGLFHIARIAYEQSLEITQEIDFDDMILFPLVKNLQVRYPVDRLFVDEAQDLSRARQDLMKKFVRPDTGRMYIVGDDRQAIYGFSGADAEALHNLTRSLNARELPLTVTWRCARKIVAAANQYVEDLEAAPNAPEGFVGTVDKLPSDIAPGDAILCRFNALLIEYAFKLIRAGSLLALKDAKLARDCSIVRRWKTRDIAACSIISKSTKRTRSVRRASAAELRTRSHRPRRYAGGDLSGCSVSRQEKHRRCRGGYRKSFRRRSFSEASCCSFLSAQGEGKRMEARDIRRQTSDARA